MDNFVIQLLLLFLSVSYITHVLLLERRTSHYGPIQSEELVVIFPPDEEYEEEHIQPVTLFDWIRRLFGVYKVKGHVWTVQELQSQRWTCPVCLSYWIAMAVVSFYVAAQLIGLEKQMLYILMIFSVACVSSAVNINLL